MKRFLLLALTAGLLTPIPVKAFGMDKREICARYYAGQFTYEQTRKKLGLKSFNGSEVISFCKFYRK